MNEKWKELKKKIFAKAFIKNMFLSSFLVVFLLFLFVNQFAIQFFVNGFSNAFDSRLQVYFLDVGQANSTLVIFPNKMAMLVDTGSQSSKESLVEQVDYLLYKNGISEIEYLLLTHSDEDHIGGTISILEEFKVENILRPKQMASFEQNPYDYSTVDTEIYKEVINAIYNEPDCLQEFVNDEVLNFSDVKVEIFSCKEDAYSDTNSFSPFIMIDYKDTSFLLTGDATEIREKEFVDFLELNNYDVDVDYLLVAHHGSKYSSTSEFLNKIKPNYAIVSSKNAYHPAVEVTERLFEAGVEEIMITRECGTIAVAFEGGKSKIYTMQNFVDIPFVAVLASLIVFVFMHFDLFKKRKFDVKRQDFTVKIDY